METGNMIYGKSFYLHTIHKIVFFKILRHTEHQGEVKWEDRVLMSKVKIYLRMFYGFYYYAWVLIFTNIESCIFSIWMLGDTGGLNSSSLNFRGSLLRNNSPTLPQSFSL